MGNFCFLFTFEGKVLWTLHFTQFKIDFKNCIPYKYPEQTLTTTLFWGKYWKNFLGRKFSNYTYTISFKHVFGKILFPQ